MRLKIPVPLPRLEPEIKTTNRIPPRYSDLCVPSQYGGFFVRWQPHSHCFSAAVAIAGMAIIMFAPRPQ